jgi:hypothetical protein
VRAAEDAVPRPAVPEWREIPERVAALEREVAAMRVPVEAEGKADPQGGLRTERVVLEVTHRANEDAADWPWAAPCQLQRGESVRVVPAAEAEVEALRAMYWDRDRGVANAKAERDAAIRERDAALARVAELQAQRPRDLVEALEARRPGAEPVAEFTIRVDDSAVRAAQSGMDVGALRRPPPRGWLTAEEREAVQVAADNLPGMEDCNGEPLDKFADLLGDLLARNSPPKVRLQSEFACEDGNPWAGGWNALLKEVRESLAAAGVEVEE